MWGILLVVVVVLVVKDKEQPDWYLVGITQAVVTGDSPRSKAHTPTTVVVAVVEAGGATLALGVLVVAGQG